MKRLKVLVEQSVNHRLFLATKPQGLFICFNTIFQFAKRSFAILTGLAILGGFIQSPAWGAGVSDLIWVETNSTAGNFIFTFLNNGTGTPTFLGSTSAGGIGVFDKTFALGPFDSDQNLIVNSDGNLLFAVNSGSNTIAVFRITSSGLEPVEGSPFPSGGSDPVSLGLSGNFLTVVNKDQDPAQNASLVQPNYTTFEVSRDGQLTPIANSTVSVAYGSSPSQALAAPEGHAVFGADFLGGLLQSFAIDGNGRLRQNLPQALPESVFAGLTGGHQPLGLRAHPFMPILYVDITPISEVAVYRFDGQGELSFLRTVPDSGAAPCWATVNNAGTRLYATNTGDNSIAVYDLTDPSNPVQIQHFVMQSNTGAVFSTVIDQTDQWLYVTSEQSSATATAEANGFHALKVSPDGTLTEPFAPAVLPITDTVPVRSQGITVIGANN